VLDVVFLAVTAALFALVALVAKGVERMGPEARSSSTRPAGRGGERSILAAVLAVAAVVYLVVALVRPEKF